METVRTIAATGVSVPVTVAYSASWPEAAAERFSTVSLPEATVSVDPVESASAPDLSEPQILMVTDVSLAEGLATTSCCVKPVFVPESRNACFSAGTTQEAADTPFKSPSVAHDITEETAPVPFEAVSRRVSCNREPSSTLPEATKMSLDESSFLSSIDTDAVMSAPIEATDEWNTEPKAAYLAEDAILPLDAWYSLSP